MTLIEMMAAILILGVLLAALAQAMQGSLRSIAKSAQDARATSLQIEYVERLLGLDWNHLELFEDEVGGAPESYKDRLADSNESFDDDGDGSGDHPLALNTATRNGTPQPEPVVTVERENVDYQIETYVMLVERDGQSADLETKRVVVFVTWPSATGDSDRTIRLEAERSPPGEALGFPPEEDTGASIPGGECFPQDADGNCDPDAPVITDIQVRDKKGNDVGTFCVNASDTLSDDRIIRVTVDGLPDSSGDMYVRYEFWSDSNESSDPDNNVTKIASYDAGAGPQFYELTLKKGTGVFRDPHSITVEAQASNEVEDTRSDRYDEPFSIVDCS